MCILAQLFLFTLSKTTNFRCFETTDNNFKFDKTGGKFSKNRKTLGEKQKLLITSNFSFSHSVFKRLLLQRSKKKGLFGNDERLKVAKLGRSKVKDKWAPQIIPGQHSSLNFSYFQKQS